MQVVAESVGVSRQTVYNEFTNKHGLARALVFTMAEAYLAEHERFIEQSDDVVSALREMVGRTLDLFAENRLFKTIISADGSDTFLPIYTSEGAPLVELACTRMTVVVSQRWPALDPDRVRVTIEALTRLVISHVVLPLHPSQQVADETATIYGGYLTGGSR
jgi:AcrR family transcriptional regulator